MSEKHAQYKRRIIRELYFAGNLSCSDISDRTNTSLPLITKIVSHLVDEKFVMAMGYAPSTGGRRPLTYSLIPGSLYVVSVAMDQLFTRIVVMDMHRNYVTHVGKFEFSLADPDATAARLADIISQFILSSGIPSDQIAGIGVGMPGFVDPGRGINYSFLKSGDKPLTQFITEHTGIETFLDNDSGLIALAEFRFGAARNRKNTMVINLGWGIGLGMILNGEYFRGHNGFAGEFSHLPLYSNNKLCSCGKSGCLETEASLLEVVKKAEQGIREGRLTTLSNHLPAKNVDVASRAVLLAAEEGDKFAVELLSDAAYTIGRGVAILIHLLNPETIVLSGRGSSAGKIWQTPIQQALNEHCIPRLAANTHIEISTLGYHAELIGGAALVIEHYYHPEKKRPARVVQ